MNLRLALGALLIAAASFTCSSTRTYSFESCPDDASHTCLRGAASPTYLPDSNRCVPNVIAQFDALKDHGEIMGFWTGHVGYPPLDDEDQHWQGIQRLAYPPANRGLMVATSSSMTGGHYATISLGSRSTGGLTGRRFGGNRMSPFTQDWNVAPPSNDTIVQNGRTYASTTYTHPSGIQTLGQYVAVPLELIGGGGPYSVTQLLDAGGTIDPLVHQCFGFTAGCMPTRWLFGQSQSRDDAVALAKLDDGRYLMINAAFRQELEILVRSPV